MLVSSSDFIRVFSILLHFLESILPTTPLSLRLVRATPAYTSPFHLPMDFQMYYFSFFVASRETRFEDEETPEGPQVLCHLNGEAYSSLISACSNREHPSFGNAEPR